MRADPPDDVVRIDHDPATGRPILVAPQRRHRPQHTAPGADGANPDGCPFCTGAEDRTPPEIDAVRDPATAPDRPGWRVRAFANLFPAAEHHEVIAEGPEHATQPAQLDAALWDDVVTVWRRRIAALERVADVRCAFLFKNVGHRAGASIAHNHSQLLGLPMLPPRLELERAQARAHGACLQCVELHSARADGRLVHESESHVLLCPSHPKLPFETWLVPKAHDADLLAPDPDVARCLHTLFCAVDRAHRSPPFNAYVHRIPGDDFHWHLELQPRTGNLAGLELGGDMYINSVSGAESAALLRDGLASAPPSSGPPSSEPPSSGPSSSAP